MSDDTPSPLNNVITIDDERIPSARTVDATDIGSQHPARYGQNDCEIALNRKNALFAGHDEGAESWACIASLIETGRAHQARQSLAGLAPRRAHAVGLGGREHGQQTRGLRRRNPRKKVKPSESCGRKAAY